MATIREIKRRIRSVKNISQVTRAMQMVAASKMRRAQEQVLATRPYAQKAWDVLVDLASQTGAGAEMHPLLTVRPVETVGLVLITADKGLCGGLNHNVIRLASNFMLNLPHPVKLITVGKKGRDFMVRHGRDLLAEFTNLPPQPRLSDVTPIVRVATEAFLNGTVDEVFIAYTDFINTITQKPTVRRLLPIRSIQIEDQTITDYIHERDERTTVVHEYIYEPSPRMVLDTVLPRFTELQVYQVVLESIASEHSARMVAMRNATENAVELIGDLTLTYNKARQEAITKEILDIAGGAEALAQARAAM